MAKRAATFQKPRAVTGKAAPGPKPTKDELEALTEWNPMLDRVDSIDESNVEFAARYLPHTRFALAVLSKDHDGVRDVVRSLLSYRNGGKELAAHLENWERVAHKFALLARLIEIAHTRMVISFVICYLSLSGENFNGKTTRRIHVKSPAVRALWRLHIEPVVLQALVDLVYPLLAFLDKANMKSAGVLNFLCMTSLHQR